MGDGSRLQALRQAWQDDPHAPRMLHYVGLASTYADLPDGVHRITQDGGRLSLTVCLGAAAEAVDALAFEADQILLPASALQADKWGIKAWARCCRRGTLLEFPGEDLPAAWREAGFTQQGPGSARFDPNWELKKRSRPGAAAPGRCAVIGAGLSGASVARALALRGWQVTVLDQAEQPASGASGLPVGLVVPHQSVDDSPRSRLSRAGIRLTTAHAQEHLKAGTDWSPSGVTEMRLDESTGQRLPQWHADGAWIKPATLVTAWLQGIRFQGGAAVARLSHGNGLWHLHGADDGLLAQADIVVLANAMGCKPLLESLALPPALAQRVSGLHAMYGTVSLGDTLPGLPATPVNGLGSLVPNVPDEMGAFWAAGAGFDSALPDTEAQHGLNLQRLQSLLPEAAALLAPQFAQKQVRAWCHARCVTQDRLPWVGEVPDHAGLWVCAGMGARGLSFAALCAEVLAARLGAEPLPQPAALLRSLDLLRQKP